LSANPSIAASAAARVGAPAVSFHQVVHPVPSEEAGVAHFSDSSEDRMNVDKNAV
jgi:hypothetical protein